MSSIVISPIEFITMLAGTVALAVGATWALLVFFGKRRDALREEIVGAIDRIEKDMKSEFKSELDKLWGQLEKLTDKWEIKADKVHDRISDHGKSVRALSDKIIELSVLFAAQKPGGGNGRTATTRRRKT